MKAGSEWGEIFKMMKKKISIYLESYIQELSFKNEEEANGMGF